MPFSRRSLLLPLILTLSACAVGPDFLRPLLPESAGYAPEPLPPQIAAPDTSTIQKFAPGQDIAAQWWTAYESPPLNKLVEQAFAANPDLQAAQAALRQAQETLSAKEGSYFPTVDAGLSVTREKLSPAAFGQVGAPSSIFTLHNASVSVAYSLDVFGGTRRGLEALRAQTEAQRFQLEAASITVAANVVTAAVQEASVKGQIAATQEIIEIQQHQRDVLQRQFELGAIAKSPLLAQEAALAQTLAQLPPLQKELGRLRNQLKAYTGRFPSAELEESFDLATLHLPDTLPVSLPSALVEQRPDIRAAEAHLHVASAQIGIATANMLPQVNLTADYGFTSVATGTLFSPGSVVWNAGAGLTQPLFHGGELLHERRAAVAAYDEAEAQYRSTVLLAFQNVADTLRALQSDADALSAQAVAVRAAQDNLTLVHDQFQMGAINYLALLDAQRTYNQTKIALVQAQAARYADTAALFLALGGGWWNRAEEKVSEEKKSNG
ncbi:MAG: efflux transporter outer membrane subunit [Alphaproteobacteria bacterium]|nr:efflux transporter outer membrane subunit [Alphaproteobacteria bacterium]